MVEIWIIYCEANPPMAISHHQLRQNIRGGMGSDWSILIANTWLMWNFKYRKNTKKVDFFKFFEGWPVVFLGLKIEKFNILKFEKLNFRGYSTTASGFSGTRVRLCYNIMGATRAGFPKRTLSRIHKPATPDKPAPSPDQLVSPNPPSTP